MKKENQADGKKFIRKEILIGFLISMLGGAVFGVLMYISMGKAYGYSWSFAGQCAAMGVLWGLLFYFFTFKVFGKSQKKRSFDDKRAQKKLSDAEKNLGLITTNKFTAFLNRGKGLKNAVCETCIYFLADRIYAMHCYFGKIYTLELFYKDIVSAFVWNMYFYCMGSDGDQLALMIKTEEEQKRLDILIKELGIYKEAGITTNGELFLRSDEIKTGINRIFAEFRFCDDSDGAAYNIKTDNQETSLFVSLFDYYDNFLDYYGEIFGVESESYENRFTPEQTKNLANRIASSDIPYSERILNWLYDAENNHNGFYYIGL